MTIVRLSNKQIRDAIAAEPAENLKRGAWVHNDTKSSRVSSKSCSVCAVGAVMRNGVLSRGQHASAIDDAAAAATMKGDVTSSSPELEIDEGNYMAALSSFFESNDKLDAIEDLAYDYSLSDGTSAVIRAAVLEEVKQDCIEFVKHNFPKYVDIDIDGAKPAKDVKVVSK